MTIGDIIDKIIELGKTIQNRKCINSLYCFGIIPHTEKPCEICVFLLLISQNANDEELIKLTTSIKFQLENFTDVFLIVHDVSTIVNSLTNNGQFAFQVLNQTIKLWDFVNEENNG